MSDQSDKTCATCRFCTPNTNPGTRRHGRPECRESPPKVFHVEMDELVVLGAFPPVFDDEWCGKWEGVQQNIGQPETR